MTVGIIERKWRIPSVETGYAFAERQIIETLRIRVVGKNRQSMRHPLFKRSLQGVVTRSDVGDICLHSRKCIGSKLPSATRGYEGVGKAGAGRSRLGRLVCARIIVLCLQNVDASRTDIGQAGQKACRQ